MNALIKLIIPVFGAIGGFLFIMTITDFTDQICNQCWPVEYFLFFSYFLFAISLLATLLGAATGVISNPSSLKGTAIGVGSLVLVVVIGYAMASDEVFAYYGDISPATSKWVGAGLYMLYILTVGAVGAIVFSAVNNILKR